MCGNKLKCKHDLSISLKFSKSSTKKKLDYYAYVKKREIIQISNCKEWKSKSKETQLLDEKYKYQSRNTETEATKMTNDKQNEKIMKSLYLYLDWE